MLKRLFIKNFAIVDELEVQFENGFQVITGETGAGKSILVGAISLLCGERASSDLIRTDAQKAIIEAEIATRQTDEVLATLRDASIEPFDNLILLRREINSSGVSRAFINDTPVNLNVMNRVTRQLMDLHGQHQHQSLLYPVNHISYLDAFGQLGTLKDKYREIFNFYNQTAEQLRRLQAQKRAAIDRHDLYSFQLNELRTANLDADVWHELKNEGRILENSEMLYKAAQTVSGLLYESDESALTSVAKAMEQLRQIAAVDASFEETVKELESARLSLEEIGRQTQNYYNNLQFNPERLEEIRNREAEIEWLLKKYQKNSMEELIELEKQLSDAVKEMGNYDVQIEETEKALQAAKKELSELAEQLSLKRKTVAEQFALKIEDVLHTLGMDSAGFTVKISREETLAGPIEINNRHYKAFDTGCDIIEFYVTTNAGESARPLSKIASGGEISRTMLAVKSILASSDNIPVLIFDEIDSGISGQVAQIVGDKMKQIAKDRQLIVITHLPQIAAQARTHYSVSKSTDNGRTFVTVRQLSAEERVKEIAGLLAGKSISEQALENARDLLLSN